jgi:hypothetical protein
MLTGGSAIAALIAVITVIKWEMIADILGSLAPSSRSIETGSPVTILVVMVCVALVWILSGDRTSEHL